MTSGATDAMDATTVFTVDRAALRPAATAAVVDWLHVVVLASGPNTGQRTVVGDEPLAIGRDITCTLVLSGSQVSRRHCTLQVDGELLLLTDLQSTNGTYVDGRRIDGAVRLRDGQDFSVGGHSFRYERRDRRRAAEALALERSIARASDYVHALLPGPLREGPVLADWYYQPCARLGGDAFGYFELEDGRFVAYIIDVAGHGVAAAMHSVSVLNVLRQRALPDVDFGQPEQVLRRLNAMFQMERHDEMYFTMWYGVYDPRTTTLRHAAAGHHAAYVVEPDAARARAVHAPGPLIGMLPDHEYASGEAVLAPGARLYLFSDGVYEVVTDEGVPWSIGRFAACLAREIQPGVPESRRLYEHARAVSHDGTFEDDVSIVTFSFAT
jgi:serine phosphatase RsbU (regulator of sigma subunit)